MAVIPPASRYNGVLLVGPSADGSANQGLVTDGSGNLSFSNVDGLATGLTSGSIPFSDGSTLAENNSGLFWDNGNTRLGIGTASPGVTLDVRGAAIFNENGGDNDFRVESQSEVNMLLVDAAENQLNLGTTANPDWGRLNVAPRDSSGAAQVDMIATLSDSNDSANVQAGNTDVWGTRLGNPTINSGTSLTVTNSAAAYIPGALQAGTNVTITNNWALMVASDASMFCGDVVIDGAHDLRLRELDANGENYVGFTAPDSLSGNQVWTLPGSDGTSGEGLITDGSGSLSFVPLARTDQAVTFSGNVNTTGQYQVNGSQISTGDVSEGSNLYYTDERVDDRVSNLLTAGTGISLSYDDAANALTITNTGSGSGDASFSGVEATRDTTFSVSNNSATIIDWDGELFDTDTYHDSGSNPSRLTVPNAGKYLIGGTIEFSAWSSLSDGRLQVRLFKNGSFVRELIDNEVDSSGGDGPSYSFQTIVDAAASDYFELNVLQVSGGSRDLTTNSVFYAARMQGSGPSQLSGLNDVDSINYTAGRVLRADGAKYVTAQLNTSDLNNDSGFLSGTAGTDGDLATWNASGELVDGPTPPTGTIVGTSDTQTITNKTLGSSTSLSAALDASNNDVQNLQTASFNGEVDNGNSGSTATIDFSAGNKHTITLTDNVTFSFTDPPGPTNLILRIQQDGTGGRTASWPSSVKWPGGSAPTLTSDANAVDIIAFYFDSTNYHGVESLNFS